MNPVIYDVIAVTSLNGKVFASEDSPYFHEIVTVGTNMSVGVDSNFIETKNTYVDFNGPKYEPPEE